MVWGAVSLMPVGGTLGDFATGLVETANGLVDDGDLEAADVTTIEELVAERGLDDCDDVIALEGDDPVHMTIIGLDVAGQAFGADCAQLKSFGIEIQSIFHFSGEAPGGEAAHFHLDAEALGPGDVEYRMLVRKGQHVGFDSGGGTGLPAPDEFDHEAASTSESLDLTIDASSDPPYDPTATYFAVVMSTSCPLLSADISFRSGSAGEGGGGPTGTGGADGLATTAATSTAAVTTTAAAGGGEGGGGEDAIAGGDGCGCRTAGDGAPIGGGLAALGAAAAIAARRLRRRR